MTRALPGSSGGEGPTVLDEALSDEAWTQRVRMALTDRPLGRLGPFELLEASGQGAQGIVYRARHAATGRPVALKRLGAGVFATPAQRERFQREMDAAIGLRNPNIVGVYGLEFIDGQPVLAMEWIEGVPIDQWARGGGPAPRDTAVILRVFATVCDAVHHAHQRGVLHRDLKPANILVDAAGQPHVLDFGLAKITNVGSAAAPLTAASAFLGTPEYAAPEQVRGEHDAVDVRTDGYALGAVLYEALTGRVPFLVQGNMAELLDAIIHREPPPPSQWRAGLDADIDAIVLKALAKEPERRYSSVEALASDVRRLLSREPIEARRGQAAYVLRKTLRRYRLPIALSVTAILLLAGTAVTLAVMYVRQTHMLAQVRAAHEAETQARDRSQRVQMVLEELLLALGQIGRGADGPLRRAFLMQASQAAEDHLRDDPLALAAAQDAIGRTYQQLGLYEEGERLLRSALAIRIERLGRAHAEVAESLHHLARLLMDRTQARAAEPLMREAHDLRARLFGADHPETLDSLTGLADLTQARREFAQAETLYRRVLDVQRRVLGHRHLDVAQTLLSLGCALSNQQRHAEAVTCFRESLDLREAQLGPDHCDTAGSRVELGKALSVVGETEAAETLLHDALAVFRRLLGDEHDNVAWAAHRLGVLLHRTGRCDEAEPLLREAVATYSRVLGPDDMYVGMVCESLAALLMDTGRPDEAASLLEQAQRVLSALPGEHSSLKTIASKLEEIRIAR